VSEVVGLAIDRHGDVIVARVTGELDLAGAPATGESIARSVTTSARGLVVDFSGLEFIDSSGVAMLFTLARRLGGSRQELRVVAPARSPVARVLGIVEFSRAARVHEELEGALAELGA
jgi:anti-anti-sigma factor